MNKLLGTIYYLSVTCLTFTKINNVLSSLNNFTIIEASYLMNLKSKHTK